MWCNAKRYSSYQQSYTHCGHIVGHFRETTSFDYGEAEFSPTSYLAVTKKHQNGTSGFPKPTTAAIHHDMFSNQTESVSNGTMHTSSHSPVFYALDIFSNFIYIIFGIFGNIFTLFILQTKSLKVSPANTFFTALALSDTIISILSESLLLSLLIIEIPFYNINMFLCKLYMVINTSFTTFSRFVLIGLCTERCLALYAPLKSATIISKFRNKIYLLICMIISVVINIHDVINYGHNIDNAGFHQATTFLCGPKSGDYMIYGYYSVFLTSLLIMFCGNCLIVTLLIRSNRMMGKTQGNKQVSSVKAS